MAKKKKKQKYDHDPYHQTKRIVIKDADVDVGIIPVVEWFNSFESVITQFSCQGIDDPDGIGDCPKVYFQCIDRLDLLKILREIRNYNCHMTIDWNFDEYPVRYCLHFLNAGALKVFIEEIEYKKSVDEYIKAHP